MKIISLQFYDYRAFFASKKEEDKVKYIINVEGKNLLIYGENGSGKSSLFKGLSDFIRQKDFTRHNQSDLLDAGFIEIKFDDNTTDRFEAAGAKATKQDLINVGKLNSFLSYKELLRTHFVDDDEVNFFDLLVNNILGEHDLNTLGKLKGAWEEESKKDFKKEFDAIDAGLKKGEINAEEAMEQVDILKETFAEGYSKFSDELIQLLGAINQNLSGMLKHFNQSLEVELIHEPISLTKSKPKINATVKYAGKKISSHHEFLNEARLSAIALSVYLAALKSNPTGNAIKFIFLDDVFIGLDLSNRLPLLDILNEEFSEWQVFLTTYDRHWFEVAKQYLGGNWKSIEMFAAQVEKQDFEHPVIIPESDNYLSKAKKYFEAKDYPASLNYLRKELERLIKERLPEESSRAYEGKPHSLSHLWNVMADRYTLAGQAALITDDIKKELNTIRFSLLNPQSHDNLSTPVYKHELTRAFDLLEQITKIPPVKGITLLAGGMVLKFQHPSVNYSFQFQLIGDWRLDIIGTNKTHHYPKCKVLHWQFNGDEFWNFKENRINTDAETISAKQREDPLNGIWKNLSRINGLSVTEELFKKQTSLENIWTIKDILNRCDDDQTNWFCRLFRKN